MSAANTKKGLSFDRHYTRDEVSPFDMFDYDYRTSVIRNPNGEKVFEMTNVEVPKHWSQIATDILAQKYFRKAGVPQPDGSIGRETSVKQVAHRLQTAGAAGALSTVILPLKKIRKYFMMSWYIASWSKAVRPTRRSGLIPVFTIATV